MTTQAMIAGTFTNVANGGRLNTTDGAGSFRVTYSVLNDPVASRNVVLSDFQPSATAVATPVITPPGGSYRNHVEVYLSDATPGATIYYTINGSDPTTSSRRFTGSPIKLKVKGGFVVRAKAFKTGMTPSSTAVAVFSIHR
jgi:hypothetical protein